MRVVMIAVMLALCPAAVAASEVIFSLKEQTLLSRKDSVAISQSAISLSRRDALQAQQVPAASRETLPGLVDITGYPSDMADSGGEGLLLERVASTLWARGKDTETDSLVRLFGLSDSDAENFGPALANRYLMRELFRQKLLEAAGK
jgi:hypothetical protein